MKAIFMIFSFLVSAGLTAGEQAAVPVPPQSQPAAKAEPAPASVWVVNKDFINFVGLPKRYGKNCVFDQVNEQEGELMTAPPKNVRCSYRNPLQIRGWAYDSGKNCCPPEVLVVLTSTDSDAEVYLKAERAPRPDVADAMKNKKMIYAGFVVIAPGRTVPSGKYQVRLWQSDREEIVVSEAPFTIEVVAESDLR